MNHELRHTVLFFKSSKEFIFQRLCDHSSKDKLTFSTPMLLDLYFGKLSGCSWSIAEVYLGG